MLAELPAEIMLDIIDQVSNGAMFKSLIFTCKMFHDYFYVGEKMLKVGEVDASTKYWTLVERFSDHRLTRIKMFGIRYGDERHIPFESIELIGLRLNRRALSAVRDLPHNYIRKNHKHLDMSIVATHNRILTADFLDATMDYIRWNWAKLTSNPVFTEKIIEDASYLPWDFSGPDLNPTFSYKFVANIKNHKNILTRYPPELDRPLAKLAHKCLGFDVFADILSRRVWMTKDVIDANPDFPWTYSVINNTCLSGFAQYCRISPSNALLRLLGGIGYKYYYKLGKNIPLDLLMKNIYMFGFHHIGERDDLEFSMTYKYFNFGEYIDYSAEHHTVRLHDLDNIMSDTYLHGKVLNNLRCSWIVYACAARK